MRLRLIAAMAGSLTLGLAPSVGIDAAEPADVAGIWLTDQRDGAVEIRPCGEELCGYVYAIFRVPDPELPLNDNRNQNPALRARPLCGLQVIGGLRQRSAEAWIDGWVYDPDTGRTFGLEITLASRDTLSVHGYYAGITLLGRTVQWTRATGRVQRCVPPGAPAR